VVNKISTFALLAVAGLVAYFALKPGNSNNDALPELTLQSQDAPTLLKIADARSQNEAIESRLSDINSELSIFAPAKTRNDCGRPGQKSCGKVNFTTFAKGTRFSIDPFTSNRVVVGFTERASSRTRSLFPVADIKQIQVAREFQSNLLTERSTIQATSRQNTLFLSSVGL